MRKDSKKGFTLTELTVVLVILAIIAAIAIPFALRYIKLAEFRKNEANAKTVFLAAESELTWYRTSGKWKEFRKKITDGENGKGERNDTFNDEERKNRIYAISLNSSSAQQGSESEKLVQELLEHNTYDKDFLNAAITIEVDVETGHVYSAFYATHCDSLAYEGADDKDVLNISAADNNRAYENRRDRLLGYYSTEDVTNVVELKPVRLKVTTINLVNSETLSLNWSSNSRHDNLDVEFGITFYEKNNKEKLFSTTLNRDTLIKSGYSPGSSAKSVPLSLQDKDGNDIGEWMFPLTYQGSEGRNSRFSLTLDGMMTAELMESLEAKRAGAGVSEVDKAYSVSITRLGEVNGLSSLKKPQDIYAVIEVNPTYQNMGKDAREYRKSSPVTSNTENTMFAAAPEEKDGKQEVKIGRFRHLSNIRYYNQDEETVFALTGRNMDWTSEGVGLFTAQVQEGEISSGTGTPPGEETGTESMRQLQWKSAKQGETVEDFPSIKLLSKKYSLNGGTTVVSHIRLGADSMPADDEIDKLYPASGAAEGHYTEYLGLFCEVEGKIQNLTLRNPALSLGEKEKSFDSLVGVGLVCGRNEGKLTDISVKTESSAGEGDKTQETVDVQLEKGTGARAKNKTAAIGGLVGVVAKKGTDGSLSALTPAQFGGTGDNSVLENLQMEGSVKGSLPEMERTNGTDEDEKAQQQAALPYRYGIGGVFGYASVGDGAKIEGCINHAKVEGNLFTGGIGGRLDGGYQSSDQTVSRVPDMNGCESDGLVLCAAELSDTAQTLNGRYFGGIVGYGKGARIEDSSSASGRSGNYRYNASERDSLAGKYVGGIIGHGEDSRLVGCSTKKGGYILGSDHVGGIAGSLSSDARDVIQSGGTGGVTATVNASYVIGNRYVGGIVGENGSGDVTSTVYNCINNGVVAGYEYYIGGIAGYNGSKGTLEDCASYLSDYDHSVFNMVKNVWEAVEGDCVGGLAGYNDGTIRLTKDSQALTVRSVSSIVTGNNFVGGMIGFNDTEGDLDLEANYTLIGGQVEASGSAVGGCIGLNASTKILGDSLEVKPSAVKGKYCVGGCIGANVVDLKSDTTISDFRADNTLGKITGEAFTGGVIGYQRTYSEGQLTGGNQLADGELGILEYLSIADGNATLKALAVKNTGLADTAGFVPMLPKVNEADNIPTNVMESGNTSQLTISQTGNTAANLAIANNNIPIQSYLYSGGVVGYCEKGSRLALVNCKNTGDISKLGESGSLAAGVSLKGYLTQEGMSSAANEVGDVKVSMVGGVISSNGRNQIIDHCANAGSMSGFVGLGGIVSFNSGGVFDCELSGNFGNAGLDYIGGIAGLNVNASVGASGNTSDIGEEYIYTNIDTNKQDKYTSGTIRRCSTAAGKSIFGRSYVGGITGYNLSGGVLEENQSGANVTAAGDYAGGIAGSNKGSILLTGDKGSTSRVVSGRSGTGVGGIAGINEKGGTIAVSATGEEVIVVNNKVSIAGNSKVGGIVGINEGTLEVRSAAASANMPYLTCEAAEVRALSGYAGGIAGEASGDITKARNKCKSVTANFGPAGGITAVNKERISLISCQNLGNVNSDYGYAGGIVAENYGVLRDCKVEGLGTGSITIRSRGTDEIGAVCAVNDVSARIEGCIPDKGVILSGESSVIGGIAGRNLGVITKSSNIDGVGVMPQVSVSAGRLTVGGVTGRNEKDTGQVIELKASGLAFEGFSNYRYLGGIAGENQSGGTIKDCIFLNGKIEESGSAAGNCYGGIAGRNSGRLDNCEVQGIVCNVQGVYTATSTSTAEEKERLASHVGGVTGKNEEPGVIIECRLAGSSNTIAAESGMAGGIAGYNNGSIELSGDSIVEQIMKDTQGAGGSSQKVEDVQRLITLASDKKIEADPQYVQWKNNSPLENLQYANNGSKINQNRTLFLTMSVNGNVGGITAYNSPKGSVNYCATGNWYVSNKSNAIGVGTGGIIGMNESEKDLSFLLNQAFVGREIAGNDTNRFAGGIIGNQNNTTTSGWKLDSCVNYGTVYCLRTHYSGGILGQWTGTGGTIEDCQNYGNLQTTYATGWVGAAAGIVAQLYHAYEGNEYNIISCKNFGNIYGRTGRDTANCANDSAGILGNVTAYKSSDANSAQNYMIQVLDCVNGPGVEIYSGSMASGIVGFFSSDNTGNISNDTRNIKLRMERCRNYALVLKGANYVGGIFGDRYGEAGTQNTVLKDCYSVNRTSENYAGNGNTDFPIVSMNSSQSVADHMNNNKTNNTTGVLYNYFLSESSLNSFVFENGNSVRKNNLTTSDKLQRVNTGCAYILSNAGKRYLIYLNPGADYGNNSFKASDLTISADNTVRFNNNNIGNVLFEIEAPDTEQYKTLTAIVNTGSVFDKYVQKSYVLKETGGNTSKMPAPTAVVLAREGGSIKITVTPAPNTQPFKYTAELYRSEDGTDGSWEKVGKTLDFFANEYSFDLPEEIRSLGGYLKVKVRAHSSDHTIEPSDETESDVLDLGRVLPAPEIRMELMEQGNSYRYRFTLVNQEDYADFKDEAGNPLYQISVKFTDGTPEKTMTVDSNGNLNQNQYLQLNAESLQQLIVQAKPAGTGQMGGRVVRESVQVPTPVYLPAYMPQISLSTSGDKTAKPDVSVSGETLDNLRITVNLEGNGGNVTTPPIYRADLIGTWKPASGSSRTNTIFASADILTAANGTVSAVFTNLPEYITEAEELKVRVWYAQSGLGPVYSYYSVESENDANIYKLKEMENQETGGVTAQVPVWEYSYSPVLNGDYFANYRWTSEELVTWLKRPDLMRADNGLTPEYSTDGKQQYTFRWDEGIGEYEAGQSYIISLTGVNGDNRISIITNEEISGNKYTADAEEWTYEKVELTVTRKGDTSGIPRKIGLTATETYQVKQRLPRPAQPTAANINTDELIYAIEWAPVTPEIDVTSSNPQSGCASYGIYLQPYAENGTTLETPVLLETVSVGEKQPNGLYHKELNLENYAGRRALVYIVAQARTEDVSYVNSVNGVTYELAIPARINAPQVTWEHDWEYAPEKLVSVEDFEAEDDLKVGKLKVTIRPSDSGSIPPGDSSYLLKAYIFDSENAADTAKTTIAGGGSLTVGSDGLLATCPAMAGNILPPNVMEVNRDGSYSATLRGISAEYAGKWILLYTRISAGGGQISSDWAVNSEIWRLPYVQLSEPTVLVEDDQEQDIVVEAGTNPDMLGEEIWRARQTTLRWDDVELADTYYVTLQDKNGTRTEYRFIEESDGNATVTGGKKIAVYQKKKDDQGQDIWEPVEMTREDTGATNPGTVDPEVYRHQVFELKDYKMEKKSSYPTSDGLTYTYQVQLNARLETEWSEEKGFSYRLLLPDAVSLITADGTSVTDSDLRITSEATVYSDVAENASDGTGPSDAYRESEVYQVQF